MIRFATLFLVAALLAACHSSDAPGTASSGTDADAAARVELERVRKLEDGCCKGLLTP